MSHTSSFCCPLEIGYSLKFTIGDTTLSYVCILVGWYQEQVESDEIKLA